MTSPSSSPSSNRPTDIVVNRLARHLVADGPLREAIVSCGTRAGARIHETRSLGELSFAAEHIARHGSDRVVLAGGDGSYMAGVTALARAYEGRELPAIALAPGGTVSTVGRNWGMRGSRVAYATHLVNAAVAGEGSLTVRPTLRVRDDAGGDRIGFIFGAGLVASFFDEYYAEGAEGYAGAARIVARIFAGSFVGGALAEKVLAPTPCVLSADGEERGPRAWTLIVASVVRDLGLHMLVTYRAGEDPARFHAVASALLPRRLGPQLPRVLAGKMLRGEGHVDGLMRELRLRFTGDRAVYVLDGEPIAAREVTVTPGPSIRVLGIR